MLGVLARSCTVCWPMNGGTGQRQCIPVWTRIASWTPICTLSHGPWRPGPPSDGRRAPAEACATRSHLIMYTREQYADRLAAGLPGDQVGRRTDGATGGCHDYDATSPPALPPQTARLLTVGAPGRCLVSCHGGVGIASLRATATLARWVRGPGAVAGRRLGRRPSEAPSGRRPRGASPVPRFRLRGRCRLCQHPSRPAYRLSAQLRVLVLRAWRCAGE